MKKNNAYLNPGAVLSKIKSGHINPVYFLKGNEHFLHRFFIQKIESAFNNQLSIKKQILIPDEMEKGELMDVLNTSDLFSSSKLLILFDPSKLKGKVQEEILSYCKNPNQDNCLIMIQEDVFKKTKFLTSLEKVINPILLRTPFDSGLIKWAEILFKEKNVPASRDVIQKLVQMFGDSIYHLANEIDKICILHEGSDPIKLDDLEKKSPWSRSFQNWEFLDVIAQKNLPKALVRGKSFLKSAPDFSLVMTLFITFFTGLYFLKISNGTFLSHIGFIPLSPYIKKRIPIGSKHYSLNEIENIIEYLTSLDRKIKTTSVHYESAFIKFLFYALR